jgi:type IV pilus assembly protein PilQ
VAALAAPKSQEAAPVSGTKRPASVSTPFTGAVPVQRAARATEQQKISVDFQDADIRAVLRLLSEQSGRNIVVSPEVKGSLTISMKNVHWEQVLDTILSLNSLVKKETDNVITVMTFDKVKKDEADRRAAEENRIKAEEVLKETQKKIDAEKGKSRQIMIEAKIVEATDTFTRNLGVQWGGQFSGTMGNSGYSYGLLGGTSALSASLTKLTTGVALTSDALALNFASAAKSVSPTFGIVVGGPTPF